MSELGAEDTPAARTYDPGVILTGPDGQPIEDTPEARAGFRPTIPVDWWNDGAMVNAGAQGDEHFVADAASDDDAARLVEAHNSTLHDDRYLDRVRVFNATEAQVRYALTALDEHEPGWREKVR